YPSNEPPRDRRPGRLALTLRKACTYTPLGQRSHPWPSPSRTFVDRGDQLARQDRVEGAAPWIEESCSSLECLSQAPCSDSPGQPHERSRIRTSSCASSPSSRARSRRTSATGSVST